MDRTVPIELNEVELAIVRRAADVSGVAFDIEKRAYTEEELNQLGVFRESFNLEEVRTKGLLKEGVVSSFDATSQRAEEELVVDAPFGEGIKKSQLPIDMLGTPVFKDVYAPNTRVRPHFHPSSGAEGEGGLRIVIKGEIYYAGKTYGPGDWFFVPNGVPYSFTTHPDQETISNYWYRYKPHPDNPNPKPPPRTYSRFSNPIATSK